MKMLIGTFVSLSLIVGFCSTAQAGGGDPGFNLTTPAGVQIGSTLDITMQTSHKSLGVLLFSDGPGPTVTPLGTFCLDFPVLAAVPVAMFPIEQVTVHCPIPCDAGLVGTVGYIQFLAIRLDGTNLGLSNGTSVTVQTSNCTP